MLRCARRCDRGAGGFVRAQPPRSMIRQLAHLCLMSHQLPAMIAFYRDGLGLPIKFSLKHDDGTAFGHYFEAGHMSFIEIFDRAGAAKQWGGDAAEKLRPHAGTHFNHFCFEVQGLEAYLATLAARGLKIDRPVSVGMDHSKQAWLKDPDGNVIELMEYTPKSMQF
jgi:catechol 2,3-dioxygenase-like lactoylglutathione lyase family enzyme